MLGLLSSPTHIHWPPFTSIHVCASTKSGNTILSLTRKKIGAPLLPPNPQVKEKGTCEYDILKYSIFIPCKLLWHLKTRGTQI